MTIIDVSSNCGSKAAALAAGGVSCVIRYYSRDTIRPSKRLDRNEAESLARAGIRLGIVHEGRYGDKAENYDRAAGVADGGYSRTYGGSTIGQPAASSIFFGIDFDATSAEIRDRVLPYFQGVSDAFLAETGEPKYVVGVYGSGMTCAAVLDAGLAQRAWLAQSTGWSGYTKFLKSKRWALLQGMETSIAGVSCDPNTASSVQDIGDFVWAAALVTDGRDGAAQMFVNARGGLNLRAGPGVEFDSLRLLSFGLPVVPLKRVGNWTLVDLQGDGAADGFVSSAFLTDVSAPAGGSALVSSSLFSTVLHVTGDALHVAELLRQGTTGQGLKAARQTAQAALPGYPTNGCAAHLSALLRQSGIDVPMIFGAGKLAHVLEDRGWSRITPGQQIAGDVGVCFDADPTPPGADHVYLVTSTSGPDQMMVADNQRDTDAPHVRFASGHGKTETEYFLRAT